MKLTAYRYAFLSCLLVASCQMLSGSVGRTGGEWSSGEWSVVSGELDVEINGRLSKGEWSVVSGELLNKGQWSVVSGELLSKGQWSLVNGHLATLQNDSTLLYSKKNISTGVKPQQPVLTSPLTNDLLTIDPLTNDPLKHSLSQGLPLTNDPLKHPLSQDLPLTNDLLTNDFLQTDSTPLTSNVVRRRTKIVAGANIAAYGLGMVWLYNAWYKDYPQSKFHTFNDIGEWKGIDKMGHAYSAYAESKASMELWRWTGIDRKKRIWLGGMSGAFYQTVIEVLDGFSAEWGWSWGDFAANIAGSGMLVAQELAWDEQRVQMKWSFHRKHYADPMLNERSNQLFGRSRAERFLKDYNGQTYWLSSSLKPFFPHSNLPAWLQVSIGTGAEGLFGGYENIGKDVDGNTTFSRPEIPRRRQWYLAPDIDLTKIKTNKKGLRLALQVLNIVKFPAPALELSRGKFRWNWIQF